MKRTRSNRKLITCCECNTPMSLEYWKNKHSKLVHPNLQNPRYKNQDADAITKHFAPKQKKAESASGESEDEQVKVADLQSATVLSPTPSTIQEKVDDADSVSEADVDLIEVSQLSVAIDSKSELPIFHGMSSTSSSGMFIDTQAGLSPVTTATDSPEDKSTTTPTLLNRGSMNITDNKSIDDDEKWIRYAGQLEVITDLNNNLINTLKNKHNIPNIIEFLTSVTTSCEEIQSLSKDLGSKSQILLNQILNNVESREDYIPDIFNSDYKVPQDPGCRPKTLTREQRMYLTKLGPFQPQLSSFPKNEEMKAAKGTYCFSSTWYNEYKYIEYSPEKDMAFCFVCKLFSYGLDREKSEDAWINGFCNWQKAKGSQGKGKPGKIPAHFQSHSHKAALIDFAKFCNESEHIDLLLDKDKRKRLIEEEKKYKQQRDVIVMMLDISRTLARQGLSFRNVHEEDSNFEQIVKLVGRYNTTMKAWLTEAERNLRPYHTTYMSKTSQEEYITLLGENMEEKILEEINNAEMIGIIADTTPDISHMDQMTVATRFIDSNDKPKERLLDTVEIKDKTGEGMAKGIIKSLTVHNVNRDMVRFQTYDSARSMSGIYKGAQKKISEMLERPIIYIPCIPHGSNLVIEHGCNASLLVRNMYDILESLYVFFSGSTKRHDVLKEKLKMSEGALELQNLSKTRWSARPDAVNAVWLSYDEIYKALEDIKDPQSKCDSLTRSKANGLFGKIKSFDFIVAIYFMKNIMFKTKLMVDVLQKETLDVSGAIISMESTLKILEFIKSNSDDQKNMLEAALTFAKKHGVKGEEEFNRVHRLRKRTKRFGDKPESEIEEVTLYSYYCKEMNAVLDMMITVLNSKCENLKSSFKPFYDVLDPNVDLKYYDSKEFSEALQTLSKSYPHELHDTKYFENELQVFNVHFSDYVQKHPEVPKNIRSAADKALFFYRKNNLFPLVAKVFKLFLTAPPSVCKSERSFSRLKILKSCLRNRINEKRLHYLMLLACEKDLTDQLDLQTIVDRWKHIKTRRIQV